MRDSTPHFSSFITLTPSACLTGSHIAQFVCDYHPDADLSLIGLKKEVVPNPSLRFCSLFHFCCILKPLIFKYLSDSVLRQWWGSSSSWTWSCRLCVGAACQSWRLLEEFPLLRCLFRRAVRTWNSGHFAFALVSFSPCSGFGLRESDFEVTCHMQISSRTHCIAGVM